MCFVDSDISTWYSDLIRSNDSFFNRTSGISPGMYYYRTIEVSILTDGFYGLEISSLTGTSIDGDFYDDPFNSTDLSFNLIPLAYKDKNYSQTFLGQSFPSKKVILMLTTYFCCSVNASFSLRMTGPSLVSFQ